MGEDVRMTRDARPRRAQSGVAAAGQASARRRRQVRGRRWALRSGAIATVLAAVVGMQTAGLLDWAGEQCRVWPRTEAGLTYCAVGQKLTGDYPDLVGVMINRGTPEERVAYVYGEELARADGSRVSGPEEAVAYTAALAERAHRGWELGLNACLGDRGAVTAEQAARACDLMHETGAGLAAVTAYLQGLDLGLDEDGARRLAIDAQAAANRLGGIRLVAYELDGVTVAGEYAVGGL